MEDPGFLPAGYRLDETDSDAAVLRRGDGTFVAAFSAQGATEESIRSAAEGDTGLARNAAAPEGPGKAVRSSENHPSRT